MPQVDFYHLTRSDMAEALVMLVKKSQLAGKKVLVQCPRPAAEAMDEALWTQDPESWIPPGWMMRMAPRMRMHGSCLCLRAIRFQLNSCFFFTGRSGPT